MSDRITEATALCECGCGEPTRIAPQTCARDGYVKGQPKRFIRGHSKRGTGKGRTVAAGGYVMIRLSPGEWAYEHLHLAERALGRPLPAACEVHHVNENKADNTPGNLVICENREYHNLLHVRARALAACGNANWIMCGHCQAWGPVESMTPTTGGRGQHKRCHRLYERNRRNV